MKKIAFAIAFAWFLAVSVAVAEMPPESALTSNPVFEKNCAKCHGKTAEGRHFGGPSLISDKVAATPAENLRSIISTGKGHMPKYASKLTSEEIDRLVQQIQDANKK